MLILLLLTSAKASPIDSMAQVRKLPLSSLSGPIPLTAYKGPPRQGGR
jgi:hypothetical protein